MSDFDYLKRLLKEYTHALELRKQAIKKGAYYAEKPYQKAKLHRLRIEIRQPEREKLAPIPGGWKYTIYVA